MSTSILGIFRSGRLVGDSLRRYRGLAAIGGASITVVDLLDVALPLVLKAIIDSIQNSDERAVLWFCSLYVGIACIQAIGRILWRVGFYQLGTKSARDIRVRILHQLLKLPLPAFSRLRSGQIVTSSQSDVEGIRTVLEHGMITLFDGMLYLLTIPLIMFYLSPWLALLSVMMLPAIPVLVLKNEKRLKVAARAAQDAVSELTNTTHESFSTVRVIKSFVRERHFASRFSERSENVRNRSVELARREAFFSPQLEAVISISMTILLFVGGDLVLDQQLTVGTYIAFQRYLQQLLWPTQAVGVWFSQLQRAAASSDRIENILTEKEDRQSTAAGQYSPGSKNILEVKDVSWSWPDTDEPFLKDISFSIARGERVAIVGPSGSGKSTLLQLLIRAVEAQGGRIVLSGIDYADASLEDVRAYVASVEQSPFLFSDTIQSNIAPYSDRALSLWASRIASVDAEILQFSDGFSTLIGERGVTLSGGQKQRVAIARSLARKPEVLVWDNALSSVDLVTEEQILARLKELPRTTSMIVVTHRLSTTLHMDRILVLNEGKIVQDGTHERLVGDKDGWYYLFCEHQKRLSQLEELTSGGLDG